MPRTITEAKLNFWSAIDTLSIYIPYSKESVQQSIGTTFKPQPPTSPLFKTYVSDAIFFKDIESVCVFELREKHDRCHPGFLTINFEQTTLNRDYIAVNFKLDVLEKNLVHYDNECAYTSYQDWGLMLFGFSLDRDHLLLSMSMQPDNFAQTL